LIVILAVIGAVRGDFAALDAVLDAIDTEGILTIVLSGNLALCAGAAAVGQHPGDVVIERVRERGLPCAQGNEDRLVARFERKRGRWTERLDAEQLAALEATTAALRSASIEFLGALPVLRRLEIDGVEIILTHGLPEDHGVCLDAQTPRHRIERAREAAGADILLSGGEEFVAARAGDALLVGVPPVRAAGGAAQWVRVSTESGRPEATLVAV